jgi:hypothetical protein
LPAALPMVEKIVAGDLRVDTIPVQSPAPATESQIQADLERLGLRPKRNPWLHVLEGVEVDGVNTLLSAGKRLCELPHEWFRKAEKSGAKYLTDADREAVRAALLDESRRGEALVSLEQSAAAEQLSFEDDAIPTFGEARE